MPPKPVKLVYGICYTNPNILTSTLRSLLDGLVKPTDIVIADYGLNLAPALKKKDHVSVIKTPNYGILSSLYAILQKYGTAPEVHVVLVDEATTYMPHLIAEYLNTTPEILRQLQAQIPSVTGAVYGLCGVLFAEDKQKDLENELESLLDCTEETVKTESKIKRSTPTVMKDTATVDLLEFTGSIFCQASQLAGFKEDAFKKPHAYNRFEATVILSNFFASKQILRVNICHLANNRFIMDRIGCFARVQS